MITSVLILGASKALPGALMWLGGMIVIVVIAGLVILKVRASMFARDAGTAGEEGLLVGLRRMRDAGQISPEEYDTARRSMAAKAGAGPAAPRRPPESSEKRSRPGYDLTGAPLPEPPAQDAE